MRQAGYGAPLHCHDGFDPDGLPRVEIQVSVPLQVVEQYVGYTAVATVQPYVKAVRRGAGRARGGTRTEEGTAGVRLG